MWYMFWEQVKDESDIRIYISSQTGGQLDGIHG
jgi:hypothetical protein